MRQLALAIPLFLLPGLHAQAQIGPPLPRAASQEFSLGVGFHNVNNRWMPYDFDVARSRFYLEGSHGFYDGLEGFFRVGVSDFVINDVESYEPGKDKDISSQGYPAFLSGGLRGNLWECGAWSIGASFEAAWYAGLEKYIRWDHDVYQKLFFDPTLEFNLGVPIGCNLGVGVLYFGPSIHFGYVNADVRTHTFGPNWDVEEEINALNVRDKAGLGGFIGWQMPLGSSGWSLQAEGTVLQGGFGIAIGFYKSTNRFLIYM